MKIVRTGTLPVILCLLLLMSVLAGCGTSGGSKEQTLIDQEPAIRSGVSSELTYDHSLKLGYATRFAVDWFKEGGCLVTVADDRQYYLAEAKDPVPKDLGEEVTVIHVPIQHGYLSGSGSMDYFIACNGLDRLKFSSQQESGWNLPEAAEAMHNGDLRFAGKYSAPDMELLKTGKCDLAIQNTMILHSPAVIEKLEGVGIPVFIDYASLETTPEGRMEWVKVYGLMTGREAEADRAFREQENEFKKLKKETADRSQDGKPTVAFFNVNSNGTVSVRKGSDYIVSMIELAGGEYNLPDAGEESDVNRSTETISMEEFYKASLDTDYFVWNSSVEGERYTIEEFLKEAPILADCKAVKDGNVYSTTNDLYQHAMGQGTFVRDLHEMLAGGTDFTYLLKLK